MDFSSNEIELPSFHSPQRRYWNDYRHIIVPVMRLVDYSSSEDDEPEEPVAESLKPAVALPELPSGVHDLYNGILLQNIP